MESELVVRRIVSESATTLEPLEFVTTVMAGKDEARQVINVTKDFDGLQALFERFKTEVTEHGHDW